MPNDSPKLSVDLEARITAFERQMAKANKTAAANMAAIEGRAKQMTSRMGATLSSGLTSALAPLAAAFGAGALFKNFIDNTIEAQAATKQLEAVIRSTGGVAGVTAEAALLLSSQLQKVTTFGDEAVTSAESLLLTFTRIGKDVFPAATETVLDMSQALGQDLKASAVQVGKALQDPILGVTALRRVGVNFSADQQKVIKDLVDTGKAAEAQKIILKELQTEFGGSAKAARETLGGALTALQNAFGDLFELSSPATEGLRQAIENLTKEITDPAAAAAVSRLGELMVTAFTSTIQEAKDVVGAVAEIETAFEHLSGSTGLSAFLGMVETTRTAVDKLVQAAADLGRITGLDQVGAAAGASPYIGQGRIQDRIEGAFAGGTYSTPKGDRIKPLKPPVQTPDAPVATKFRAPKKTADDRFAEDLQAIRDRTAALNEEYSALGLSFEAQTKRKVALDLEQTALKQVREEARKKGDADWQNAQLSPAQVAAINAVSEAYAKQADELRKAQEMQDLQRDVLQGAFDDMRGALDDGKLDWQDFSKVAMNALERITADVFTIEFEGSAT